jgi:hypothetical protein
MPNLAYQRGYNRERKIKQELEGEGYALVVRTAGSHSPVDVIAIKEMAVIPGWGLCFTGKLVQSKTSTRFKHIRKIEESIETKNGSIIYERWEFPTNEKRIKHINPKRRRTAKQ